MEIRSQKEGDLLIASLIGRLDSSTSAVVQSGLFDVVPTVRNIILELSSLEYMNSAGLRSLLDIAKKLRAKSGKLVLAEMPPMIREIYEIAGFRSIIPAYPNLHDARESLGGAK